MNFNSKYIKRQIITIGHIFPNVWKLLDWNWFCSFIKCFSDWELNYQFNSWPFIWLYNLCFIFSNWEQNHIFNIYFPRFFQWSKESPNWTRFGLIPQTLLQSCRTPQNSKFQRWECIQALFLAPNDLNRDTRFWDG